MKKLLSITSLTVFALILLVGCSKNDNAFTGTWYSTDSDQKIIISKKSNTYDLNLTEINFGVLKNNTIENKTKTELILVSENGEKKIRIYVGEKDSIELYIAENTDTPSETPPLVFKKK